MKHASTRIVAVLSLLLAPAASFGAGAKRVFITSGTHGGNFGGIGGANTFCQAAADNASPPLVGTFRAWLSTSTDDAYCNVTGFSGLRSNNCGQPQLPGGGPYERVDGVPFARSLTELTDSRYHILSPLNVDENGSTVSGFFAFTGTGWAGQPSGGTSCSGWTLDSGFADVGSPNSGAFYWTQNAQSNVCDAGPVYCFEVGTGGTLDFNEGNGALAFVTSSLQNGALGGLAGADNLCRTLASSAHLPNPNSFVAWLSSAGQMVNAIDRLTWDGPYKRVDGLRIADNKADLVDAASPNSVALDNGLWMTEADVSYGLYTLTGTAINGTATGNDCGGWTLPTGNVEYGQASVLGLWTQGNGFTDVCSSVRAIDCFSVVPILFWDNFESFSLQRWSSAAP